MTSEILNLKISPETIEAQIELIAREFFSGKDMSHASPISYGELVWLMRKLMSVVVAPPVQPSEEFAKDPSQITDDSVRLDILGNFRNSEIVPILLASLPTGGELGEL